MSTSWTATAPACASLPTAPHRCLIRTGCRWCGRSPSPSWTPTAARPRICSTTPPPLVTRAWSRNSAPAPTSPGRRSDGWRKHPLIRTTEVIICGYRPRPEPHRRPDGRARPRRPRPGHRRPGLHRRRRPVDRTKRGQAYPAHTGHRLLQHRLRRRTTRRARSLLISAYPTADSFASAPTWCLSRSEPRSLRIRSLFVKHCQCPLIVYSLLTRSVI